MWAYFMKNISSFICAFPLYTFRSHYKSGMGDEGDVIVMKCEGGVFAALWLFTLFILRTIIKIPHLLIISICCDGINEYTWFKKTETHQNIFVFFFVLMWNLHSESYNLWLYQMTNQIFDYRWQEILRVFAVAFTFSPTQSFFMCLSTNKRSEKLYYG